MEMRVRNHVQNLHDLSILEFEDRKSTVKGLYRDRIQGSLCAGVYMQEYFKAANFPHNMPDIWTRQWGHLVLEPKTGPAVVVGE